VTSRLLRSAAATVVLLAAGVGSGCAANGAASGPQVAAAPSPSPTGAVPTSAAELEALLLEQVPSGLPLVPDDELDPPAGEKTVDDVAGYGDDAAEQRSVLTDYGYLRGWERFWRADTGQTSVFLDQFERPEGAGAYAHDLARNDAEYYGGMLDSAPGDLPAGCVTMARDDPAAAHGLAGPAAFAWCSSGVFTVAVAAVARTPEAARAEVTAVTVEQLDRLRTN
jgi:hypothetical protein